MHFVVAMIFFPLVAGSILAECECNIRIYLFIYVCIISVYIYKQKKYLDITVCCNLGIISISLLTKGTDDRICML